VRAVGHDLPPLQHIFGSKRGEAHGVHGKSRLHVSATAVLTIVRSPAKPRAGSPQWLTQIWLTPVGLTQVWLTQVWLTQVWLTQVWLTQVWLTRGTGIQVWLTSAKSSHLSVSDPCQLWRKSYVGMLHMTPSHGRPSGKACTGHQPVRWVRCEGSGTGPTGSLLSQHHAHRSGCAPVL